MDIDILEQEKQDKERLLNNLNENVIVPLVDTRSINDNKKKIATYENILRFYQNSIKTFALSSHKHYTQDIVTDKEHRFVTDEQIESINTYMKRTTATDEQIQNLFSENLMFKK